MKQFLEFELEPTATQYLRKCIWFAEVGSGDGVLSLTVGYAKRKAIEQDVYGVEEIPAATPTERAFQLIRITTQKGDEPQQEPYVTRVASTFTGCTCKAGVMGFLNGPCKHVEAVKKLIELGALPERRPLELPPEAVALISQEVDDMGLIAKDTGEAREPAPAGTHQAWCFGLIDLGTQTSNFKDGPKAAHKVWIWWLLANEVQTDGKPVTAGTFYSLGLNEKSNLRKMLQGWRGKPFTEEELAGFDLRNILGKPCLLTIAHTQKDNKVRDVITAVGPLMKNMKLEAMTAAKVIFDIDNWDAIVFDGLPDFLKRMIADSPEGKQRLGLNGGGRQHAAAAAGAVDPYDDSEQIPF